MDINELIENKKISKYRLSKASGVPYATLSDICSGKTSLEKCSAETVYKLAKELNISMEDLLSSYMEYRPSFEIYKSETCHRLKEMGDINFIIYELKTDSIKKLFEKKWYPESLYLLAMVDYISRINDVPMCSEYDGLRKTKLSEVAYPSGILALDLASNSDNAKKEAWENSIPEFKRFNIVENEVRNVV